MQHYCRIVYFANNSPPTSCSLEELQHYRSSGKWIVKHLCLNLCGHEWLSHKWKSTLESICSLWQGGTLEMLIDEYFTDLQELRNWPIELTFNQLNLRLRHSNNTHLQHLSFPLLYKFSLFQLVLQSNNSEVNSSVLLKFLENIPVERQNKLIVQLRLCFCIFRERQQFLFQARQSFAAAKLPCSYHLQIIQKSRPELDATLAFRLINERRIEKSNHHAEKKAQKELERMLLLSSPSKCAFREQLLAEADHLVEQIKIHKEQLQSMQRNLKLIKKELKRSVLRASKLDETNSTEAGPSSQLSPDLIKNSTRKSF
uniref:Uncharacterized protein n=1 Tax=Ditylenchus dipsaci TaxID=166011 RepID=A0A915EFL2_9BILA